MKNLLLSASVRQQELFCAEGFKWEICHFTTLIIAPEERAAWETSSYKKVGLNCNNLCLFPYNKKSVLLSDIFNLLSDYHGGQRQIENKSFIWEKKPGQLREKWTRLFYLKSNKQSKSKDPDCCGPSGPVMLPRQWHAGKRPHLSCELTPADKWEEEKGWEERISSQRWYLCGISNTLCSLCSVRRVITYNRSVCVCVQSQCHQLILCKW